MLTEVWRGSSVLGPAQGARSGAAGGPASSARSCQEAYDSCSTPFRMHLMRSEGPSTYRPQEVLQVGRVGPRRPAAARMAATRPWGPPCSARPPLIDPPGTPSTPRPSPPLAEIRRGD
jgi:hypothetical protein